MSTFCEQCSKLMSTDCYECCFGGLDERCSVCNKVHYICENCLNDRNYISSIVCIGGYKLCKACFKKLKVVSAKLSKDQLYDNLKDCKKYLKKDDYYFDVTFEINEKQTTSVESVGDLIKYGLKSIMKKLFVQMKASAPIISTNSDS